MSRDPHNGSVEKHRVWCWRNTECKHIMRWCGSSPAVSVFNPLMTRTITHHSFDPVGTVEKWHDAAHLENPVVVGMKSVTHLPSSTNPWLSERTVVSRGCRNHEYYLTTPRGCRNELLDPVRYVTSLWWCKIFHKGDIFRAVGKFDEFENFLHWENFPNFSQCNVFSTRKYLQHRNYLHSQTTAYVHAIMTPYASSNRVTCRLLI